MLSYCIFTVICVHSYTCLCYCYLVQDKLTTTDDNNEGYDCDDDDEDDKLTNKIHSGTHFLQFVGTDVRTVCKSKVDQNPLAVVV